MAKYKIQRDDTVIVTTGKHKGATGRVIDIMTDTDRVIIEQVNLVTRQIKPQGGRAGGTVEKEAAIHISNVSLYDAEEGRKVKAAWSVVDGKKVRIDRKTGAALAKA
ncbi:MAG: 50S ribosomal protein L24 [Myxococcota bacterium]|jgi:large subunit ribosomal protein L24|nr:50S ribosomal protein L24 [Myxococcota bacterium]MEC9389922.1 50S ribosomal protein L24 [Myxococcota bacterium]